jgi:hypothetical protein
MLVAEENYRIVYLLGRLELVALFRYCIHYIADASLTPKQTNGKPILVIHNDDEPGSNRTGGHILEGAQMIGMSTGMGDDGSEASIHTTLGNFDVKRTRYVDVMWPGGQRLIRYYAKDHPRSAEVLRIARPVDQDPAWIEKYIKP